MGKAPTPDKATFPSIIGTRDGHGDTYLWLLISSSPLLVKEKESFTKTTTGDRVLYQTRNARGLALDLKRFYKQILHANESLTTSHLVLTYYEATHKKDNH